MNHISVILPVYNCEKYLKYSISSILSQTYEQFELIVVNDGSTDNTKNVIESIPDFRIRYYEKEHSGLADSLNYGIQESKHDIIARMDADDISLPKRFEEQIKYIDEYDIISSSYVAFKDKKIKYAIDLPQEHNDIMRALMLHSVVCHPAVMFKKDVVQTLGGYIGSNNTCDYELWCRASKYYRFKNISEYLHLYRIHGDSITAKSNNMKMDTFQVHEKYYPISIIRKKIKSELEVNRLLGWREYFYGEKNKAREYWSSHLLTKGLKETIAFIFTFLPKVIFDYLINKKVSVRFKYYAQFFNQRYHTAKDYLEMMN